jgi:hypothetical protein
MMNVMEILRGTAIVLLIFIVTGIGRYMWLFQQGRVTRWTTWSELSKPDWWLAVGTIVAELAFIILIIVMAIIRA